MGVTTKKKPRGWNTEQHFFLLVVLLALFSTLLGTFHIENLPRTATPLEDNLPRTTTTYVKPPLEDYIQGWNITKDVNWLLDFSIVGFPKTGTSTLMHYLISQNRSIFMFQDERCEIGWNQHVPLLKDLYQNYDKDKLMGIKCPNNLEVDYALENYRTVFPKTKFIVGIRNPIRWFESFYNFRIHNEFPMPPPQKLVGKCKRFNRGVCTERANFSKHLSKIDVDTRNVFLYDVNQLKNKETMDVFLKDLTEFLGLETPLPGPMIHFVPGRTPLSEEHQKELQSKKIDICEDQYQNLRGVLREQASKSAEWILTEFLSKPNVKVSSPDYFKSMLDEWHRDPCDGSVKKDSAKKDSVEKDSVKKDTVQKKRKEEIHQEEQGEVVRRLQGLFLEGNHPTGIDWQRQKP